MSMTEETAMRTSIRERVEQMQRDLEGWRERGGYLVPTDPDAAARALTRIELRAAIATLARVLGEPVDPTTESAQHRDRMRIADDAVENYKREVSDA